MRILFDSKNLKYKTPFGCVRQNETVKLNIYIPRRCTTLFVCVCVEEDNGFYKEFPLSFSSLTDGYDVYSGSFSLSECGIYRYYFRVRTDESKFRLFKQGVHDTNMESGEKWQLTCYPEAFDTPEHFKGTVMYQIFPDRFSKSGICDTTEKLAPFSLHDSTDDCPCYLPNENGEILNNDFFGGNLKGIEEKILYLTGMGVKTIYLNPIFKAFSNHRYDTADYKKIDPLLGTEQDFISLCKAAHKNGMKIILDGVFSHVGSNSIYFDKNRVFGGGAYSDQSSKYKEWFDFQNYPDEYTSWWGISTLPCVNELNADYLNYIIFDEDSVINHWMKCGADGFRLDVADELPDEFIRLLKKQVKANGGFVTGEVWEDASNKEAYGIKRRYFVDDELDSVMNYPFRTAILDFVLSISDAKQTANAIMTIVENYPKPILDCVMNSLSTHDTMRCLTLFDNSGEQLSRDERAVYKISSERFERAVIKEKCAAFLQFMLPGSPCIYYGDEAGLEGFGDPFNRKFYPWGKEDENLISFYKQLAWLKNTYPQLRTGCMRVIVCEGGVLGFKRDNLFAFVNVSPFDYFINDEIKIMFDINCEKSNGRLCLKRYGVILYEG